MNKPTTETGSAPSATAAPAQRWPKIVASPVTWESGATAYRMARTPAALRLRRPDPVQRADLW